MAWHVVKGNTIIMHIWYHWHHKQTHYFFTTHPNIFHQTGTLRSHTFYVKCGGEGGGGQIGDKILKRHAQLLLSLVNKYVGAVAQEYFPWKSMASHEGSVLTAGADVAQVHSDLLVKGEAPGTLHLAPGVTAEVVAPSQLRILHGGQVVAVGVLGTPRLAGVARLGDAHRALVVGSAAIVAAVICWRIFHED